MLSLLCLLGVISLGKSLNRVQSDIFDFYSHLRLWDINELALKCHSFLSKNGKTPKKKRRSSILKIFPAKTIADIVSPKYRRTNNKKWGNNLGDEEEHVLFRSGIDASPQVEEESVKDKEVKVHL